MNLKKHTNSSAPSRNSQKLKEILRATVAPQDRLAFSRLRVTNLNSAVTTAAGKLLSIGAPCHRHHTVKQKVSTRINRSREKITWKKNLPVQVAGQSRLAMASGNVPDFDGAVVAAASDKFAVRRKSNGVDPVIETSEHMKHTGT